MSGIRAEISHLVNELRTLNLSVLPIEQRVGKLVGLKIHALPVVFEDITPKEYMAVITELAELDASSALSLSMHLYTLWGITRRQGQKFAAVLDEISTDGRLMGSLNEPALYFLAPGQLNAATYPVKATRVRVVIT